MFPKSVVSVLPKPSFPRLPPVVPPPSPSSSRMEESVARRARMRTAAIRSRSAPPLTPRAPRTPVVVDDDDDVVIDVDDPGSAGGGPGPGVRLDTVRPAAEERPSGSVEGRETAAVGYDDDSWSAPGETSTGPTVVEIESEDTWGVLRDAGGTCRRTLPPLPPDLLNFETCEVDGMNGCVKWAGGACR